jgi:hypothetical protein
MTEREIDLLVIETINAMMKQIDHDGEDIVVGQKALDALRSALVRAHGEKEGEK